MQGARNLKKVYVLDTSVLLHDPHSIFSFEDNTIIIPAVVIEEIDSKKHYQDELGRNARKISRILDNLRQNGHLHKAIPLDNGGSLTVELNHRSLESLQLHFPEVNNDNRILAVALNLFNEEQQKAKPRPVIIVSKDTIMRIKADALGITAQDYLSDQIVHFDNIFHGFVERAVHPSLIDQFYLERTLPLTSLGISLYPNEFVLLKDEFGSSKSALAKYNSYTRNIEHLIFASEPTWGITPRNAQQKMAMELLLDDDIQLITLTGRAGTGKTLLGIASALLKTQDEQKYKKLLIARPIIPMGKDIGYLPGDKAEKLKPWIQPIYDNLEYLFANRKNTLDDILLGLKNIQIEALTYIRGRSIPQQFIIIDEAQNLTKHEVKTIISRVGEGSKIVLMGDPEQIDHPYLDSTNNGLTYVVEKFKDQTISGHVTLLKGERSKLAQLAADIL